MSHLFLPLFLRCGSVSTDTRKMPAGCLFFALRGDNFNGNRFAAQALEGGAAAVLVDDPAFHRPADARYHLVENSLATLQSLAQAYRASWDFPVFGLTGSNGKTTTKELLVAAIGSGLCVHATAGNYNNHIGVPLTLLATPSESELAVVEMGTNQPGDIAELVGFARPTHGLITNIGKAHIEKLGSVEGIRIEKGALYDHLRETNGVAFVNQDDSRVVRAAQGVARQISYGTDDAIYHITELHQRLDGMELRIEADHWAAALRVRSALSGAYNASNILAAVAVADHFGVAHDRIAAGIAAYRPDNHRSQLVERDGKQFLLDHYNANPSSMQAAIEHVFTHFDGKIALLLGEMRELGTTCEAEHRALGALVDRYRPEVVIGVGEPMRDALAEISRAPTHYFATAAEAKADLPELIASADLVLVKGSRGARLEAALG